MNENLDINIDDFLTYTSKHTWRKMGSWNRENFGTVFFDASKDKEKYRKFDIPINPPVVLRVGCDGYISEESVKKYVDFHLEMLQSGDFAFYDSIREKQGVSIEDLKTKLSSFTRNCNISTFDDLFDCLGTLHVLFDFDRTLSDAIEVELARLSEEDEKNQISFDQVLDDEHESQALILVRKLRELKARREAGNNCKDAIDSLVKDYGHLGFYQFKGKPFNADDFEQMLSNLSCNTLEEERLIHSGSRKFSAEVEKLTQLASKFSAHRLQRVEVVNEALYAMRDTLDDFFKGYGVEKYWDMVCPQIVSTLAKGGLQEPLVSHDNTVIYVSGEGIRRLNLCDSKEFKENFSCEKIQSNLKGTRASTGTYEGKARVVLDPSSCEDFEDGDILVCSMTDPNYLALMIRAGAFVTEKGGILCHAAILARELRKPCLVGVQGLLVSVKDGATLRMDCSKETLTIL